MLTFRALLPADLDGVLKIERVSFPVPWDANDFQEMLLDSAVSGEVAIRSEEMVGFCLVEKCQAGFA